MIRIKSLLILLWIACILLPKLTYGQTNTIPFTFVLTDSARTSAGVFTKDGTLVRTLWSGVTYAAGTYTQAWDGKDDQSRLVPDSNYEIRVLTNKVTYTWEGLIGNTSSAPAGPTHFQAGENMASMAIAGNTAYYAVNYNEQRGSTFKLDLTNPQAKSDILGKGAAVWLVATDGTRVYWAGVDPNKTTNSFVFVTNTSDDAEATLANATPVQTTYGRKYTSAICVNNGANSIISGLAVQKSGNYLLVSRKNMNAVYVHNKLTGALVATISANAPRELAIDKDDNVWMITGTNTITNYKINTNGILTTLNKSLTGIVDPMALSVSPDGATLIVADAAGSQQLKAFDPVSAKPAWTFGQPGGYITDPAVSDDKFYFSDLRSVRTPVQSSQTTYASTFIAFEANGSFWVYDFGNNRAQHYNADRSFINRVMYLPGSLNCSVDHNNPTRLFSNYLEFAIDYTQPLGPTNGSWTLTKNWGAIITSAYDANYYIGRLRFVETLSNGHTYATLCVNNAGTLTYEVVELPSTGPLRFTGIRFPSANYQLYPDGSLRVQSTAKVGSPTVWQKQTLIGFDSSNNPQWADLQTTASSPIITSADPGHGGNPVNLTAGETTSSNIVIAFDASKTPTGNGPWFHLGGVRVGTSKWLWRTAPSTATQYTGDYPTDGAFDIGNGVNNAGSRALALDRNIFWGYYGEFWKGTQTNKWQHVYDNGLFIGQFGQTGKDAKSGETIPGLAGNAFSGYVIKSPIDSGSAYLYHNDDGGALCGVHRWKISGLNTINEQVIPVVVLAATHGLLGDYFDGHELNNVNLKTSRIDATVNNDWPNGPTGTKLKYSYNFSSRWQGFVQPAFSEAYTFFTDTNGKLRLWIDGNLVIDQWTNTTLKQYNTSAINMEAGKRYAIRLEYTPIGNAARVGLWWSSKSQPKQIIPTSQLIPAENTASGQGIDLMAFLAPGKVLENNLYGWVRSPIAEDYQNAYKKWWSAKTGFESYGYDRLNSSDLWVKFISTAPSNTYTITRNLTSDTGFSSWGLSGKVYYDSEGGNKATGVGYFEVLDDQSKVLVRLFFSDDYPNLTMYANNNIIAQLPKIDFTTIISQVQPISIQMSNGTATIKYGPYPAVTTSILDGSANWKNPRTMRFYFTGDSYGTSHAVGVESMRFSTGGQSTLFPNFTEKIPTLSFYPNPVKDVMQVEYPEIMDTGYLEVFSLSGQKLNSWPLAAGSVSTSIDVRFLSSSIYILNYVNGPYQSSKRFIKQ